MRRNYILQLQERTTLTDCLERIFIEWSAWSGVRQPVGSVSHFRSRSSLRSQHWRMPHEGLKNSVIVFALISCATLDFTRPEPSDFDSAPAVSNVEVLCLYILYYLSYLISLFCVELGNYITAFWLVVFIH